ncbi:hypothetical protein JQ607_22245 [Bradyrhizobium liaoningense]|uniref:hypothetical protein n=1 Tax=Bradyrhizobium liaoningense TaxID=43992 RepID=UPI001BA8F9AA|nr:hypothetical protein [Bradyrhizobium liaoningense]MBR0842932.1 hypothetical protein [Bradyrhizobium liaoningense]
MIERRSITIIDLGLLDFETIDYCELQNAAIMRRLFQGDKASLHEFDLGNTDGNWLSSRDYRSWLVPEAYRLLRQHPGEKHFMTITHPKWKRDVGDLDALSLSGIKQWHARRFATLPRSVLAIGGIEVSLGVDLRHNRVWEGHSHMVVAGARAAELSKAFVIERHYREKRYLRPVVLKPIGNLARQIAYSVKRIGTRRIAYIGDNGRQQRRGLPLLSAEQVEFDRWLLSLTVGTRTILFGCRRHGRHLCLR